MPLKLCVSCLVTSAEKLRVNSMFGVVTRILHVCPHLSVVLNCGLKRHSLPLYGLYLHLASTHLMTASTESASAVQNYGFLSFV